MNNYRVSHNPYKCKNFFTSTESLALIMREKFDIPDDEEVRLWKKYISSTFELLNKREQTLQEVGLYSGLIVIIEARNKDGTWPRGGTGEG